MTNDLLSHVQLTPAETVQLLAELGFQYTEDSVADLGKATDTEARKMLWAMAVIQMVATSLQKELNMKNYSVAFSLSGALKYWERR